MAGYVPFSNVRPILHRGPPPMPVVDINLVRPQSTVAQAVKLRVNDCRKITDEVAAKIVAMRQGGAPYSEIGAALRVSTGTIAKYARHVPPPPSGWKVGAHPAKVWNRAKAERMRRAGFSYREIGYNIGSCGATVYDLLNGRKDRGSCKTPLGRIVRSVTRATGVRASDIRKPRPGRVGVMVPDVCRARAIVFWLARQKIADATLSGIGRELGGFCHSSALGAVRRVDRLPGIVNVDLKMAPARIARAIWSLDWSGSSE